MKSVRSLCGISIVTFSIAFFVCSCLKTRAVSTDDADARSPANAVETVPAKTIPLEPASFADKTLSEYVIYTCRTGTEDIPAVRIAEIQNINDSRVTGVGVHVSQPQKIDLLVKGAKAVWEYKAVSSRSGKNSIQVTYDPQADSPGYDWVLKIKSKTTDFKTRVRDCVEVSSE